jgi:hypothetical protein
MIFVVHPASKIKHNPAMKESVLPSAKLIQQLCCLGRLPRITRIALPSAKIKLPQRHGNKEENRKYIYPCKSVQSVANKKFPQGINIFHLAKIKLPQRHENTQKKNEFFSVLPCLCDKLNLKRSF